MIDDVTVIAAIVVGLLCDVAGVWCLSNGRPIFGVVLIVISAAVAAYTWRYYLNHIRP